MSGTVARYVVAVVAAVAAIALRVSLSGRIVGTFLLAYPPVFVAAAVGGLGPGVVATGLTALLSWMWVIRPSHPLAPVSPEESLGLLVFVLMGVLVSAMSEALRRSRRRAARLDAERQLWLSEERQRSVTAAMSEGIVIHDGTGTITLCNDAAVRILGLTRDEITGRTSRDPRWSTVHEDGSPFPGDDHPAMVTLRTGQSTHGVGMGVNRPDGSIAWIEINSEPVLDEDGTLTSVVVTFADVTERLRLEREREAALRRLHQHLANTPLAVIEWDGGYRITRFGGRAEAIFGWKAEEVVGKRFDEVPWVPEEDWPKVRAVMTGMAERTAPVNVSANRNVRKDGRVISCEWFNSSLHDEHGKLRSVFSLVQDVTEREEARRALAWSEQRYRTLLEVAPVPLFVFRDERIEAANPAGLALAGATRPDQVVGHRVDEFLAPADRARAGELFTRLAAGHVVGPVEFQVTRVTGEPQTVEVAAAPFTDERGVAYHFVERDVTEQRRTEQALVASEARFRTLADQAPIGIVEIDLRDDRIVYANTAAGVISGRSPKDLVGATFGDGILRDDVEHVREAIADVAARGGKNVLEFRVRRPDGSLRTVRSDGVLVHTAGGSPTYLALQVDVTDLRAAQQALATRSRLEAMGTLVAGVGHEINNPLAVMIAGDGYVLELVQELLLHLRSPVPPSPPEVAGELEGAVEALSDGLASGRRIARIVKDLALFGQARATEGRVRLRDAVDLGLRWLPEAVRSAAHVEVEDAGAPDVVGLTGQLSQMVLNLVSNACRSGREGQLPRVRVRLGPGAPGKALLEVTDDGVGMGPETLRQIFNPFFTTRPAGDQRGTGLGLSVSQAIAAAHGGAITVESAPGKGSTFRVELPAA